jgi:hypothetical protein
MTARMVALALAEWRPSTQSFGDAVNHLHKLFQRFDDWLFRL